MHQIIYGGGIFYFIVLTLVKISILLMYYRIFPLPSFRIAAWILSTTTIIWAMTCWLLLLFQCIPIKRAWDPLVPGKCINIRGIFSVLR